MPNKVLNTLLFILFTSYSTDPKKIFTFANPKPFISHIIQKQPSRGTIKKRCFGNVQQIYRRTPMLKCDFNKNFIEITLRHWCSPVNLLHIFRTLSLKNTSRWLLLIIVCKTIRQKKLLLNLVRFINMNV